MLMTWIILVAVLGQTTQPAVAEDQLAQAPQPTVTLTPPATRPAATTQPAVDPEMVKRIQAVHAQQATQQIDSAAAIRQIGELTGNPIDVQVTADGMMVLSGEEKDLAILEAFVQWMDTQQPIVPQFRIFQLKSGDASDLADKIQRLWNAAKKPATGDVRAEDRLTVIPEPRANVLMIAATEANMGLVEIIIQQLDQPSLSETVKFQVIQLEHIKSAEAETILTDMLKSLQQRRGVSKELMTIKADVRSNTLLISAPEADMEQIRHLISLIDIEPTEESGGVVKLAVFPLEKAVAADLAESLIKMLQNTDTAAAMKEQIRRLQVVKRSPDGSELTLSDLDLEKPVKIIAEKGMNAIIVATSEKNLRPVGEIIRLLDTVPLADEMLVNIFPLEHADADTLMTSLRDMFEQGKRLPEQPGKTVPGKVPPGLTGSALAYNIGFSVDKRTNTLIVSGRPEQMLVIQQVIRAVDVEEAAGIYAPRLVRLEHADVKAITEVVTKLVDQQQKVVEKVTSPMAAERERTLIIPDPRTNSLIVVAKDDNYRMIADLVEQLDAVEDQWLGQIHIVNLENLTATSIADQIKELWERRAEIRREGNLPEDKPVVVADTRSNSLVIASNQEDYEAIAALVKKLEDQKLSPMADIRAITLQHNDVTKVGEIVRKLFEERLKISLAKGQEEQPGDRIAVVDDPMTRTLLVASSKSNFAEAVRLVKMLDVPPTTDGLFQTFPVRNADITKAGDVLKEIFDKGIYIGSGDAKQLPESATKVTIVPDLRSSMLIVSASPQNLAIVEALLKEIDREDVPVFPTDARFFPVQNADVVNLADMLEQMFEGMKASITSDQKDQLEVKIIPDTRSKMLIVTGTRYAIKRAEELVPRLDVKSEGAAYSFQIYPLQEATASRLEPIITDLFDKRATQDQAGKRTPIHIIADDGSNSLIITAPAEDHTMARELVGKLDRKSTLAQQMQVVPLKEAKADQLSDTLTKLVDEQQGDRKGGFTVIAEPRTNSLLVWAAPDLMANIRTIIDQIDNTKVKREMALRTFKLNNANAEDLAKLLDDFFEKAGSGKGEDAKQMIIKFTSMDPKTGERIARSLVHQDVTITPDKNTNSLMVMAPQEHIDMLEMLIDMLDKIEPVTATIQVFTLRNADATSMQKLLEDLFKPTGQDEERRRLVFAAGETGPAPGEGTAVELAFSVDERTNSLIVAGSPSYLKIVERLVFQLDFQEIEDRIVRVVQARNRPADQIAETMKSYFEEESSLLEQAAEGEAKVRQLQRQVTIQDGGEGSNTILISYNPRMESQVITMINELDRAPAQVMIQVLMAEVTLENRFEMGMEFAVQDLLFSETATVGRDGLLKGDNYDTIFGTDIGASGESGLGGISFTVTGEDFNFLIRALQSEGRLEILSRPAIMVQDNQEAKITVGERVPTVQDLVVSSAGVVTPSVTYEEVGVILDVKPIVNADGYVNMEIAPEISAIGTSTVSIGSGVTLPVFTERSAETTVTVKDGETIVIGGLITSSQNEKENKVPLAGDIPILGNLFRANVRTSSKTELLIVLTPHVIRTPEEARTLSVQLRDQTGLMDNARNSPLMEKLQVRPEEDQFGPADMLRPTGDKLPRPDQGEMMGPDLEELGPPVSSIQGPPSDETIAARK